MLQLKQMFKLRRMRPYSILKRNMPPTVSATSCSTAPGFSLEIVHLVKKQTQTWLAYKNLNSLQFKVAQLHMSGQKKFCARETYFLISQNDLIFSKGFHSYQDKLLEGNHILFTLWNIYSLLTIFIRSIWASMLFHSISKEIRSNL